MSDCQFMRPILSDNRYCGNRFFDSSSDYSPAMRQTARSEYGQRLLQARKHAELTQTALAKAVDMSQSAYAEAEMTGQGSTFTSQLAAKCGVRPEWLATGSGPMLPTDQLPDGLPEAEQLAESIALVAAACEMVDKRTRKFVGQMFSELAQAPEDVGNISRDILRLLVTERTPPKPREDKSSSGQPVDLKSRGLKDVKRNSAKRAQGGQ